MELLHLKTQLFARDVAIAQRTNIPLAIWNPLYPRWKTILSLENNNHYWLSVYPKPAWKINVQRSVLIWSNKATQMKIKIYWLSYSIKLQKNRETIKYWLPQQLRNKRISQKKKERKRAVYDIKTDFKSNKRLTQEIYWLTAVLLK